MLKVLKSSTFIRSLNMHLYRSNINLKIDIPYSLPLPYVDQCAILHQKNANSTFPHHWPGDDDDNDNNDDIS